MPRHREIPHESYISLFHGAPDPATLSSQRSIGSLQSPCVGTGYSPLSISAFLDERKWIGKHAQRWHRSIADRPPSPARSRLAAPITIATRSCHNAGETGLSDMPFPSYEWREVREPWAIGKAVAQGGKSFPATPSSTTRL